MLTRSLRPATAAPPRRAPADAAIREISRTAEEVNTAVDNIGARRLHTILERIVEDISYEAPERVRWGVAVAVGVGRWRRGGGGGGGGGAAESRAAARAVAGPASTGLQRALLVVRVEPIHKA